MKEIISDNEWQNILYAVTANYYLKIRGKIAASIDEEKMNQDTIDRTCGKVTGEKVLCD